MLDPERGGGPARDADGARVSVFARLRVDWATKWSHVPPQDLERVRIVVVRWWLPQIAATTFGRLVVVRRGHEHDERLMAHEVVHVRQWRTAGSLRFLRTYLGEYLGGRRRGLTHMEAYRSIGAEVEARALADGLWQEA